MKTFLINTVKGLKRLSNELDVKSAICDKEWIIFNDDRSVKEVYIFQKDGTLIASFNGKITYASWEYLSANHSFIFKLSDKESYMFKPVAFDQEILTLQLDGENRFCFFLTENLAQRTGLSLPNVKSYLLQHCQFNLLSPEEQAVYDHQLALKREKDESIRLQKEAMARQQRLQEEKESQERMKAMRPFFAMLVVALFCLVAYFVYNEIERQKERRLETQRQEVIRKQKEEEERKRWNPEIYVTREENKRAVDLGLSVEWATCNVGANAPEEIGNYYCFGFPDGKPRKYIKPSNREVQEKSDAQKRTMSTLRRQGLDPDMVYEVHYKTISNENGDMAKANWGNGWRLPTREEAEELVHSCKLAVVSVGNVKCFQFTGKNGNRIIIPFGGSRNKEDAMINGVNKFFAIWTGTYPYNPYDIEASGITLDYSPDLRYPMTSSSSRKYGIPVRAVRDKR